MKTLSFSMMIFVAGIIFSTSCYTRDAETSAQVTTNVNQDLEARVDGTVREAGTLESAESVEFHSLIPGETTILSLVPNGTLVQQGDLLIELDNSLIEERHNQQQIATLSAQADGAQALSELEIAKLEAEVALAETQAALSQEDTTSELSNIELEIHSLEKQLATLQKKIALVAKQQSKDMQSSREVFEYEVMRLDLETDAEITKEKLEHLKTKVLPQFQKSQARQLELAKMMESLQKTKSESNIKQAQKIYEAKQFAAKVEQQRLEELKRQLEHCRIVAPRDGIIVYANQSSRRTEPAQIGEGATVRERQLLLKMPDLAHLQMNVHVHESKIARIKQGQSARIRFDALPEQVFQGKVTSVGDTALPGVWPNLDVRQFEVIVSLEKPDPRLKLGLTGVVEIDVSK